MAKIDTYTKNRIEALPWALKIIESAETVEQGVENLKKEIRLRNATFIPLEIPAQKIHEVNLMLSQRLMNTLLIAFLKVFEEEFGWRKVRLQRVKTLFLKHSAAFYDVDPYGDRYFTMSDYAIHFREDYGIDFDDKAIDELLNIEKQNEDKQLRRVQFDVIEKHLKNSYPEALVHLKKQLGV